MIKISIVQEPVSNILIGYVDPIDRSDLLSKSQKVVASFDVSYLCVHDSLM